MKRVFAVWGYCEEINTLSQYFSAKSLFITKTKKGGKIQLLLHYVRAPGAAQEIVSQTEAFDHHVQEQKAKRNQYFVAQISWAEDFINHDP